MSEPPEWVKCEDYADRIDEGHIIERAVCARLEADLKWVRLYPQQRAHQGPYKDRGDMRVIHRTLGTVKFEAKSTKNRNHFTKPEDYKYDPFIIDGKEEYDRKHPKPFAYAFVCPHCLDRVGFLRMPIVWLERAPIWDPPPPGEKKQLIVQTIKDRKRPDKLGYWTWKRHLRPWSTLLDLLL